MGLGDFLKQRSAANADKRAAQDEALVARVKAEEIARWGKLEPGDEDHHSQSTRSIIHRYVTSLGIDHLMDPVAYPKYAKLLSQGYFEPIPVAWLDRARNPLTEQLLGFGWGAGGGFADRAEERLYWVLNHSIDRDSSGNVISKPKKKLRPLNDYQQINQQMSRMNMLVSIDSAWASPYDQFRSTKSSAKMGYSKQVPPMPISNAFKELYANQATARELGGQGLQTDEVDVMLLVDVSGSMGAPHPVQFCQPLHIDVVHNILKRAIHHLEVRDHYSNQGGAGVETVCFNSLGFDLGKVNWANFESKWRQIRSLVGGGTLVMQGWQKVKNAHFTRHGGDGKSWYDETYGWQATPRMAKLSLLLLLDGEANDMDEFELELLAEKWAYVTICLIGKDGCPDHARHAAELTRIAKANDHVNFLDIQGRVSERLVVSDVLQRVLASQAPTYDEIMDPRWEIHPPGYTDATTPA